MGEPDSQFPKEWNCSESIPMVQVSPPTLAPSPVLGEGARVGLQNWDAPVKAHMVFILFFPLRRNRQNSSGDMANCIHNSRGGC